jgi:Ca2+-binding EF-hand superfamily protein
MSKHLVSVVLTMVLMPIGFLAAQDGGELFNKLDANKDGYITPDEVQEQQKALYDRLLRTADKDGDKKLSKEEFQAGLKPDDAPKPPLAGGQGFPGRPNPARPGATNAAPDRGQLEALFDRTDSNSDGKLTKDEIPEERQGMRAILERSGGDSITKEQFVREMMTFAQAGGQPPRPDGAPPRRPDGPPGPPPGGGLFGALDTDRNGELSTSEIVAAGTALLKLDRNGDGKLTPDEAFGPGGTPPGRPGSGPPGPGQPPAGRPGGGFDLEAFDTNKDGKISKEEAPDRLKQRFDQLDTNGDGFLDAAERRQMAERMQKGGGKAKGRPPGGDQPRPPEAKSDNK